MCCQVPQRTSPTGPKNTPNPARLGNVPSGILRKNSPAARNGGTEADAQILELNQQVGLPCPGLGCTEGLARPEGFSRFPLPQLMDLKLTVDGLEKERDFYFSKLRDIELICQEHENENSPIITGIVSVLYATEVRAGHLGTPLEPRSLCCFPDLPGRGGTPFSPSLSQPCSLHGEVGLCQSSGHARGREVVVLPVPPLCRRLPWLPPGGLRPTRGRRAGGAAARGAGRVLAPAPARARAPRAAPAIDIGGRARTSPCSVTRRRHLRQLQGSRRPQNQRHPLGEERGCAGGWGWGRALAPRRGLARATPSPYLFLLSPWRERVPHLPWCPASPRGGGGGTASPRGLAQVPCAAHLAGTLWPQDPHGGVGASLVACGSGGPRKRGERCWFRFLGR